MDLSPSAEQVQLVDAFSALYAKESSTDRVRAAGGSRRNHRNTTATAVM